jgi:HK97 family phage portal protein
VPRVNLIQRAFLRLAGVKARPSELLPAWQHGQPARKSTWEASRAIRDGYTASSVVATCLDVRGDSLASVPWKAYRLTGGAWQHQPDSPLQRLLDRPNPFMSPADIKRRLSDHTLLAGNGLLLKNRGATGGAPLELWPLRPDHVTPIIDRVEFLRAYEYNHAGTKRELPAADVVHVMRPNPDSDYWGVGALQAGGDTVANERAAIQWQTTLLHKQAITSGIVGVGNELNDDAWDRMKAELDQRRLGESRSGETIFVDGVGTISYQRLGLDAREMALVDSRRLTREDIMSMFRVPPPIVGYLERANYANIETARRIFWQDTVAVDCARVAAAMTRSLAPDFGTDWAVDFDLGSVDALQENFGEKLANFERLIANGVRPEVAAELVDLGLPADAFVEVAESDLPQRAEAMGALIRAGVKPEDAARLVGLDVTFRDAMPVTLRSLEAPEPREGDQP